MPLLDHPFANRLRQEERPSQINIQDEVEFLWSEGLDLLAFVDAGDIQEGVDPRKIRLESRHQLVQRSHVRDITDHAADRVFTRRKFFRRLLQSRRFATGDDHLRPASRETRSQFLPTAPAGAADEDYLIRNRK